MKITNPDICQSKFETLYMSLNINGSFDVKKTWTPYIEFLFFNFIFRSLYKK